ncbi:MAG: FRG domain-containing protein [Bacteroidia bacterium]|nr:FRG domain-containing protein [Bacteroidia bacterium]
MGRKPRWIENSLKNGIKTITLSSWKYFHDYLQEELLDYKNYVFRGQRDEHWKLEPSINRHYNKTGIVDFQKLSQKHLDNFKFSLRGRFSNLREIINDENELWALGQHHGLVTPLLDFTFSPYAAAYFAFFEKDNPNSRYRIVYAISQNAIEKQIDDQLNVYKPISDHNSRLLNQSGLFVKFESNLDIETLFKQKFELDEPKHKLIIIRIPNTNRDTVLKMLNKMNINHNTLFPDIEGTSIFTNMQLEIGNY